MKYYIEELRHISDKSIQYNDFVVCRVKLPTRNNNNIEWSKTIGYVFDFSYKGISGYLTIVDYNTKLYFKINDCDDVYSISIKSFKKAGFDDIIKICYYNYNVGDIIKNKEILEVSHKDKYIIYKYKCLNDGYIGSTTQANMNKNSGFCPVCTNNIIVEGVNDIPTVAPWMIPYFKGGYDEAKLFGVNSKKIKELQCPYCGKSKETAIINVYQHKGFFCECSDKISYPEKCMINLLTVLNIDYRYQCGRNILSWISNKYHYDFYIPSLDIIIETNGSQHYKETPKKSKWTSLEIIQERDLHKKNLALSHNIKHYIELDCSESNIEKFKESIINSELPTLLSFDKDCIDWDKIDQSSMRNIVKEICLYKEEHPYLTPQEIANHFNITKKGINKYYKLGEKFGWCTYNKEQIKWVSHFHRNTHYLINGCYFYNIEDITARSFDVFGEKLIGSSVATYIRSSSKNKLFNGKYMIDEVSHKEYLLNNKVYPSYINQKIIDGLLLRYN